MRLGTRAPSAGPRWAIAELNLEGRPAYALLHALGQHVLEVDLFTAIALPGGRGPLELVEAKGFDELRAARGWLRVFDQYPRLALGAAESDALTLRSLIDDELGARLTTELRLLDEGYWPRAAPTLCTKCPECKRWNYHLTSCSRRGLR
jgi:hypothetical protein